MLTTQQIQEAYGIEIISEESLIAPGFIQP